MNWLQLVSSSEWPVVAVGALFMFRKNLHTWFEKRPDKVKAGMFEAEWNSVVDEAVGELASYPAPSKDNKLTPLEPGKNPVAGQNDIPTGSLLLRFRDITQTAPIGAIIEGWVLIELELRRLFQGDSRLGANTMIKALSMYEVVPEWTVASLRQLMKLRNLAVHAIEPITPLQAFEFLALADPVLYELRRVEKLPDPPTRG